MSTKTTFSENKLIGKLERVIVKKQKKKWKLTKISLQASKKQHKYSMKNLN